MAGDLSGVASLDMAIGEEFMLKCNGLPAQIRRKFPADVTNIFKAPLLQRKSLLVLVRASRKLVNDNRIQDEFTDPRS